MENLNPDDQPLQRNTSASISQFSCFIISANYFLGMGLIMNSRHYRCGIIFTSIVNAVVALLTYYTTWMMLQAARRFRTIHFETTWRESGYKASFIISIGIAASCLGFAAHNLNQLNKIYQIFVLNLLPNAPDWLIDGYMLDFILILFLYLPAALDTKYRSLMIFSYIKSFMTIIFLVLCVYWFVRRYVKDGFDPSDSVVIFFSSKEDYISCISEFVGSYISFPFLFVAINPMYNLTFNRANHMVKVIYIIYFLTLEIFGLFQYFTIYNIQGEVPFLYVMNGYHWSIRVARIVFMVFLACTLPALVEPMRQSMIFIIEVTDNMPKFVWCSMAILCLIASALFSTLTTRYYLLLTKLATAASMFMQFIVPPLLLLKQMDVMPKWHWVLIVLFIIGGTGITIYSIASIYELF